MRAIKLSITDGKWLYAANFYCKFTTLPTEGKKEGNIKGAVLHVSSACRPSPTRLERSRRVAVHAIRKRPDNGVLSGRFVINPVPPTS